MGATSHAPERIDPRWASVIDEDLSDVDIGQQIACVKRELALRQNVYPKWVAAGGRLTQSQADKELRAMRAVLKTLLLQQAAAALAAAATPPLPFDPDGSFHGRAPSPAHDGGLA